MCEDLSSFIEGSTKNGESAINPFSGLRILSQLNPIHWSLLTQEQIETVEKAYVCLFSAKEVNVRAQGIAILAKALTEMESKDEVLSIIKFIRKVVVDLDQRPQLQQLIEAKENALLDSQQASLQADLSLIEAQLKGGLLNSRLEGVGFLASLWVEPASSIEIPSSAPSSSSSPPAAVKAGPQLSLRAFKGMLKIIKDKEDVIKMMTYFQLLAQASLKRGDVNMYVAIVGALTDNDVLRKIEAYNTDRSKKRRIIRNQPRMELLFQNLKALASTVSSNENFKKLKELNIKSYENYLETRRYPPVPTINYMGQHLTFARDGNKAIKTNKTVNTTFYDVEVNTLTYLSNCLDSVKSGLTQGARAQSSK